MCWANIKVRVIFFTCLGQTCASMDGSCVTTENECANDVVPGLGCSETGLCCLPPVCKKTGIDG